MVIMTFALKNVPEVTKAQRKRTNTPFITACRGYEETIVSSI